MTGIGWPSHDEDEKARIARCYTKVDQSTGCPLCIARAEVAALRAENERLREALEKLRTVTAGFAPYSWEAGLWLVANSALAPAAPPEDKEENRGK